MRKIILKILRPYIISRLIKKGFNNDSINVFLKGLGLPGVGVPKMPHPPVPMIPISGTKQPLNPPGGTGGLTIRTG